MFADHFWLSPTLRRCSICLIFVFSCFSLVNVWPTTKTRGFVLANNWSNSIGPLCPDNLAVWFGRNRSMHIECLHYSLLIRQIEQHDERWFNFSPLLLPSILFGASYILFGLSKCQSENAKWVRNEEVGTAISRKMIQNSRTLHVSHLALEIKWIARCKWMQSLAFILFRFSSSMGDWTAVVSRQCLS